MFDISGITAILGCKHYIYEIEKHFNSRGDADTVKKRYEIFGVVQMLNGSDLEVKEGILAAGDIIAFYDDKQPNLDKLKIGNQIYWNKNTYTIKNVMLYEGHIEVYATKA